jgi:hypothetical protein
MLSEGRNDGDVCGYAGKPKKVKKDCPNKTKHQGEHATHGGRFAARPEAAAIVEVGIACIINLQLASTRAP